MPRGKAKPKPIAIQPNIVSVQDRIRAAERAACNDPIEKVHVSESDLEIILDLITESGMTKDQVLRKAVRLGLQVLKINPKSAPIPETDPFEVPWAGTHHEIPLYGASAIEDGGYTLRRGPTRYPEPSEEEKAIDAANHGGPQVPAEVPF